MHKLPFEFAAVRSSGEKCTFTVRCCVPEDLEEIVGLQDKVSASIAQKDLFVMSASTSASRRFGVITSASGRSLFISASAASSRSSLLPDVETITGSATMFSAFHSVSLPAIASIISDDDTMMPVLQINTCPQLWAQYKTSFKIRISERDFQIRYQYCISSLIGTLSSGLQRLCDYSDCKKALICAS